MKVLFISGELISGDLAYSLQKEGCDVRIYIQDKSVKDCFDGMLQKVHRWRDELGWVGKDGLIVFDDVGYGEVQDALRSDGYQVVGGSGEGDRFELDRLYGQDILREVGVGSSDFVTHDFDIQSAINFVKANGGEWVVKQNDHDTALNYVGSFEDGSDVISVLENYKGVLGKSGNISLQRRVRGVEIAVGRFFNGNDWVGPSVINFEHKHLCNDDIGPLGGETGTLMWYDENDDNKLFKMVLAGLKNKLQEGGYKGYIDVNCIVEGTDVVYPLEITSRFGSSTVETQSEIQTSPWSEFLMALAKGENYNLEYKRGYGLNVAVTVPPFPYRTSDLKIINKGASIFFSKEMTAEDFSHFHFEGVSVRKNYGKDTYFTAGDLGYVLYVTGMGSTVQQARERVYGLVEKITIPKMFYRTDIGSRFIRKDEFLLKKWGWI